MQTLPSVGGSDAPQLTGSARRGGAIAVAAVAEGASIALAEWRGSVIQQVQL